GEAGEEPELEAVEEGAKGVLHGGVAYWMVIEICALALLPPESVVEAVMVWVPEVSVLAVMEAPAPRSPFRSEVQWMVGPASSRSEAVAVKVTFSPAAKVEPSAGPVMLTLGVELTTTVMEALALLPPLSVTCAVMVCVPELRVLLVSESPVPRS